MNKVRMYFILDGALNVMHKKGVWEYLLCMHLPNGKCVRQDTMTDEQGKKYTKKEIDEINKKEL